MHDPDPALAAEHVQAALEASCETLIALELIQARVAGVDTSLELHTTRGIDSLLRAIEELRTAQQGPARIFWYGFVAGRDLG